MSASDLTSAELSQDEPAQPAHGEPRSLLGRFVRWARRVRLERRLSYVLLLLSVTAGIATFVAMTGVLPAEVPPDLVLLLLYFDLVLLLGLGALIARRLVVLWVAHKRGTAGARLHTRLVALFALVAVTPAVIVATTSILFLNFGLEGWFSSRVSTAVKESLAVAQSYLEEHLQTIRADALAMATDLNREGPLLLFSPYRFNQVVSAQQALRSLTETVVFDRSGRVIARAGYNLLLEFDAQISDWAIQRADRGEVVILRAPSDDRVRALIKLDLAENAYLLVGRLVDPRVLEHMSRTEGAVQLYETLEGERSDLQIIFASVFVVVALLLLLAAVWIGLAFANYLTGPLGRLIAAAEDVRRGNLATRVRVGNDQDELSTLSRSFNRMTGELQSQQQELLDANRQLETRHAFIEAVLGGVSAGILGLDAAGRVELPNRSASELLGLDPQILLGRPLAEAVPDFAPMLRTARRRADGMAEQQIALTQADGSTRTLFARVQSQGRGAGYVVTFDDVTELMAAQRKAAWADVARRIAHEIKNPLTPIQLSAERLKRRYLKQIEQDPETFRSCTDTIVRHVEDIGRMVDEFSAFARMPQPRMERRDLRQLVEEGLVLHRTAHPDIRFESELPTDGVATLCDPRQISQAYTNLLRNAVDAIEVQDPETLAERPGRIAVSLRHEAERTVIRVIDNGVGLPRTQRERLTEPYVTTKPKGTGLGLAIVRKIMEDHGGRLELSDRSEGGAEVALILPKVAANEGESAATLES